MGDRNILIPGSDEAPKGPPGAMSRAAATRFMIVSRQSFLFRQDEGTARLDAEVRRKYAYKSAILRKGYAHLYGAW